jgi:nitroimidazol reductase NimA-like FMN-containing flavoprotein (pyridoxamine 5'-phosphate oxidase superfamily)
MVGTHGVEPHRTAIERIGRDECVRLLAADEVGRLAVNVGRAPTIFPVNYRMDGEAVVFRTDWGTKLDMGRRAPVSFEIDGFDRAARTGWSVVVAGRLEEVTEHDAEVFDRVHRLAVDPWAGGEKSHWVRIVPGLITGRRVGPPPTNPAHP